MAIYVVMEPAESRAADPDRVAYVRDGFSLIAFLVPLLWLLWRRLWIEALLVFAAGLALGALGQALDFDPLAAIAFSLLIGLYVGLEGAALRIAALRRRGWREWGVVEADDLDEAETRYLAETIPDSAKAAAVEEARSRTRPAGMGPALGLLDYPGNR